MTCRSNIALSLWPPLLYGDSYFSIFMSLGCFTWKIPYTRYQSLIGKSEMNGIDFKISRFITLKRYSSLWLVFESCHNTRDWNLCFNLLLFVLILSCSNFISLNNYFLILRFIFYLAFYKILCLHYVRYTLGWWSYIVKYHSFTKL